jgi:hypothetical protein
MRVRPLRSALALFVFTALALAPPAADNGRKPDLQQLKRESELFETIVLTALGQAVPNPLFIAEKPRGTYLDGYGITFNFTLNMNRSLVLFPKPAQQRNQPPAGDEASLARNMATVRKCLTEILGQYGASLKQLPSEAKISIIAHVMKRSVDPNLQTNRIMILTVTRADVEQYQREKISFEDFKKRVGYLEY